MLVEDEEPGLVDEDMAGPDDSVKGVQITAAGDRGTGVQRLVEASHLSEHRGAERHVRSGSEGARASRIQRVAWEDRSVADSIEPAAKSAAPLECDLGLGLQFHWQDQAGESGGVAVCRPRVGQTG